MIGPIQHVAGAPMAGATGARVSSPEVRDDEGRGDEGRDDVPAEAYAAALVGRPMMGPARLTALLATGHPVVVWRRVAAGDVPADPEVVRTLGPKRTEIVQRWRAAAARLDVAEVWHDTLQAGVSVAVVGTHADPSALAGDIEPPAVVFHRGALEAIDGRIMAAFVRGTKPVTSSSARTMRAAPAASNAPAAAGACCDGDCC